MRNVSFASVFLAAIILSGCAGHSAPVAVAETPAATPAKECVSAKAWVEAVAKKTAEMGSMHVAAIPPDALAQAVEMYHANAKSEALVADSGVIIGFDRGGAPLPVLLIGLFKDGCMVGGMVRRPVVDEGDPA